MLIDGGVACYELPAEPTSQSPVELSSSYPTTTGTSEKITNGSLFKGITPAQLPFLAYAYRCT